MIDILVTSTVGRQTKSCTNSKLDKDKLNRNALKSSEWAAIVTKKCQKEQRNLLEKTDSYVARASFVTSYYPVTTLLQSPSS